MYVIYWEDFDGERHMVLTERRRSAFSFHRMAEKAGVEYVKIYLDGGLQVDPLQGLEVIRPLPNCEGCGIKGAADLKGLHLANKQAILRIAELEIIEKKYKALESIVESGEAL